MEIGSGKSIQRASLARTKDSCLVTSGTSGFWNRLARKLAGWQTPKTAAPAGFGLDVRVHHRVGSPGRKYLWLDCIADRAHSFRPRQLATWAAAPAQSSRQLAHGREGATHRLRNTARRSLKGRAFNRAEEVHLLFWL